MNNVNKLLDPLKRDKPLLNTHTIEIETEAGQQIYNIPDADFLRDKPIIGMVMRGFHADRKSKNGRSFVSDAVLKESFLTLMIDSKAIINDLPMEYLVANAGDMPGDYATIFIEKGFDPSTSSIRVASSGNIVTNEAFEITFIFMNPDYIECK
ncbi:MAG: hypothetical protein GXO85_02250 [Chlorobi bacterium]|nr:hypothetical protein [Chlorobiota bacterium]